MGLCAGLVLGGGLWMLLMFPLVLSFVFMVTGWLYCLRGWIASLMTNPRRRRQVIVGLTIGVILLAQTPNLINIIVFRHMGPRAGQQSGSFMSPEIISAHRYVPIFWAPAGRDGIGVDGDPWPALLGTLGAGLIGSRELHRSYRSTMRFYLGHPGKVSAARMPARSSALRGSAPHLAGAKQLPLVPEEPSALAMAFLRCISRGCQSSRCPWSATYSFSSPQPCR